MRRVGASPWMMVVSVLVWLFMLLCAVYGVWALVTGEVAWDPAVRESVGVAPGRERLIYCLSVPLFAGFVVFFAYTIFYKGAGYILYNEEMVVFVLNRRDRRSYRWQDLRSAGVTLRCLGEIEPAVLLLEGWLFEFPDGKRMPVRAILRGYREFVELLTKKGLLSGMRGA